jgi:hypothetical protein
MAISNTYIEPTANLSLNSARFTYNDSMRAILTNFKSPGIPGTSQINIDGAGTSALDGMLYRSSTTNALYIADALNYKGSSVGGIFTRWGIGHRVEPSAAALTTNLSTYEIGELVATLDTGRLYIRTSNTGVIGSFSDVGATAGIAAPDVNSNIIFTGQSITALKVNAINNISVGTANPTQALDIRGGGLVTGTFTSNINVSNTYNLPSTAHVGPSWTTTSPSFALGNRIYLDNSSAASATVTDRTATSILRPTFNTVNATVLVSRASTMYIEGAPSNTSTNAIFGNAFALHVAANGIFLASTGTLANPLIAMNTPNNGFYAPTGNTIAASANGVLAATFFENGNFTAVGNITAYSDERLKTDIRTIDNALDKVSQMRGVYFIKGGVTSTGVIAQEIEKVVPEVVYDGEFKSVAYGNLVGILIEAIKELQIKIDKLESRY